MKGKPSFPDLSTFLDREVYPSLFDSLDTAFPEFGWKRNRSGGWTATTRETTKQVVNARPDRVVCNQPVGFYAHGGSAVRWLDYVNGGSHPRGSEFPEAVRTLAKHAGIPFPEIEWTEEQSIAAQKTTRERNLQEDFWKIIKDELGTDNGQSTRNYLINRGFKDDEIEELPFGLYPKQKQLINSLLALDYDQDELQILPGLDEESVNRNKSWWEGRLVGIWRTRNKRPQSFWGRAPEWKDDDKAPKYLYCGPSTGFFGIDKALNSLQTNSLLIVEGLIDVIHLQARGFSNIVALGGKGDRLSAERWQELINYGVSSVTLGLDADSSGIEGCRKAIENLIKVEKVRKVYLLNHSALKETKDPDGYLRAHGIEAFKKLVSEAEHFYRFKAREIINAHKPINGWTDVTRDAAVVESLKFYEQETSMVNEAALQKYFLSIIKEDTEITDIDEHLQTLRNQRHIERIREAEQKGYKNLIQTADELIAKDVTQAKGYINEELQRLKEAERNFNLEPVRSLDEELPLLDSRLEKWRGKEFIGLPQRTIRELDDATSGLRGLMLLAAPPNVGKTALAVQIGMDVVEHNSDTCFLFLSLEMPRIDIYARMMGRWAEMDWKTLTFGSDKGEGVSYTLNEHLRLEEARKKFNTLGKRIRVLDETNFPNPTVDNIIAEVEALKASTNTSRVFVLVDYLQVWPISGSGASEIEQDKFRIGQMKTLKNRLGDEAVMVISEARKPSGQVGEKWGGALSDIMGSARGSYTPDIVFLFQPWTEVEVAGVWNLANSNGKITNQDAFQEKLDLLDSEGRCFHWLNIAKGRDGVTKKKIPLTFWYRQASFEEGVEE
jgi:DNA primase catalytic core